MDPDHQPDGQDIAERLAEAVEENESSVADISVVAAETTVEPTPDGSLAYEITHAEDRIAAVYAHPDRAHVEFRAAPDAAADAAASAGLRVRPKATRPPQSLVFVESDAQVDPAVDVFRAVLDALE